MTVLGSLHGTATKWDHHTIWVVQLKNVFVQMHLAKWATMMVYRCNQIGIADCCSVTYAARLSKNRLFRAQAAQYPKTPCESYN